MLRVLTGDEVVFEQLINDLRLEEQTPLLVLYICLLGHSLSRRFRDHDLDSFRVQPIENLPKELSFWQLVLIVVREMLFDAFPIVDLWQNVLDRELRPVRDRLGRYISLS